MGLNEFIRPRRTLFFLGSAAVLVAMAWFNRFVQDDAFISFVYARNLATGQGLTWFGTRVEGYTNFLWVMWMALGLKIGIAPVAWSYLGGLISYGAFLFGAWRLALLIFPDELPALLTIILLGVNYTVSSYATGGLETMLQAALLVFAMYLLYELTESKTVKTTVCLGLSWLLALAFLTRMDSALPAGIMFLFALFALHKKGMLIKSGPALLIPFFLIAGVWIAWKWSYYGRILPNTFYAKVGLETSLNQNGLVFLYRFFHWYGLWPFFLLGLAAIIFKKDHNAALPRFGPLLAVTLAWICYLIMIGGDFMEFRFLVPIAPFLFIFLSYFLYYSVGQGLVRRPGIVSLVGLGVIMLVSVHHARTFSGITKDMTLDSISGLSTFYDLYPDQDWGRIGKKLQHDLGDTNALIATHAVGAIPFYSGLKTIDMWGLNDPEIAAHGNPPPRDYQRPGHRRHVTLQYLKKQQVNLIIGNPTLLNGDLRDPTIYPMLPVWARNVALAFNREPIGKAVLVAMPLDRGQALVMWYLIPTEPINRAIAQNGWQALTIQVPDIK